MCSRGIPDRSDPFASFGESVFSRGLQMGRKRWSSPRCRPVVKPLKRDDSQNGKPIVHPRSAPLKSISQLLQNPLEPTGFMKTLTAHIFRIGKTRSAPCFRASVPRRSSDITFWPFMDISFAKIPPYDSHPLGKLRLFKMQKEIW